MTAALATMFDELVAVRSEADAEFFGAEAERLARCCHQMAERFARDGRLIALGHSAEARSDARHVAVEFVHPVIVGKRALPAVALVGDGDEVAEQARLHCAADDIVIGFGCDEEGSEGTREALTLARERGCLTIAFARDAAEWEFVPVAGGRFVRQELIETLYHVLWELVHVFFDHRGLLEGRGAKSTHDAGASSFLYPFLSESETELDPVLASVRESILQKATETAALRAQTLAGNREALLAAAAAVAESFAGGGTLFAFGNGGSATDAMDLVADLRAAGRRVLDLTEDTSILTALANDVGVERIFQRQVIAHGRAGDTAVALSTSGNSLNIVEALAEARRRELVTVAMVGYDGGRVAAEDLADHVIVTRSQHIPRIQEAQASAYHVLCELVNG